MGAEENKALVERFYTQLDAGVLEEIERALDPGCVLHYPNNIELHGPQGYRDNLAPFLTGLPDFKHIIEDIVTVGDKVVVRFTIPATHKGDFLGIAPTGKKVSFTAIAIFRIHEARIAEAWVEFDALGLLQQLGADLS
jgi:predicted ester cyclase